MLQDLTGIVCQGTSLDEEQAEAALSLVLDPDTPDRAIEEFLVALAEKGEAVDEVAGFARGMRKVSVRIRSPWEVFVDTAGTGGGASSFNVSTAAALVIAAAGIPVAKHGNRAMTSRSGSADVLRELGVPVDRGPEVSERALAEAGICFLYAPLYHPAMKRVVEIRRRLGRRTIFNLVGPLTNPAGAPVQLVGAWSRTVARTMAGALARLGSARAWVVHSRDGLDEISSVEQTDVAAVEGQGVTEKVLSPPRPQSGIPEGGEPAENARLVLDILEGRASESACELVLINAAAAIHLATGDDLQTSLERAEAALESGCARDRLNRLARIYA